ncbi:sodium:proton antiporter [Corynebacterium sp. ES2730-CONJ]|nr:sodium:proton antiporter [Corynebacterium sp. ES2730-CONJ]MCS4530907.1 sodium:proton antiporter [Corynebacterium sp. ES2730-CONJ]
MLIMIAVIALIGATVVMVAIGERTGLPWPALLTVVTGAAILFPGIPTVEIPPDLILPIFIPPLLWALARRSSWGMVRRQWLEIALLAVVLTVVSSVAIGISAYALIPSLSLAGAMMIGAAIAPTDPVAVDAVAKPAGVPYRISNTLQNEGLFNDAASIMIFSMALSVIVEKKSPSWWEPILAFIYGAGVAVIVGLMIGFSSAKFVSWVQSSTARNALTWTIPFATYLVADALGASGVVAIVVAAVEYNSKVEINAQDRLSGTSFWQTVEFLFTGVAFGLIGTTVRRAISEMGSGLLEAVLVGVALSVVAIVVRMSFLLVIYRFNTTGKRKTASPLRLQEVLLLTFAGMRGLVTLTLVLSIPSSTYFKLYHELPVIVLVVLIMTMVIPGLALPALMKKLNLDADPDAFGDRTRTELASRARKAARGVIDAHAKDLPQDRLELVMQRFEEFIHYEDDAVVDPKTLRDHARKEATQMAQINLEALRAAQQELLAARNETKVDPVILDEVLYDVDQQILGIVRGIELRNSTWDDSSER